VSSRNIEHACYEDLAFQMLNDNQQPDHSRISDFRRRNLDALKGLLVQILKLCQKAGMVSLGHVALNYTKMKANASKHKAISHERMLMARGSSPVGEDPLARECAGSSGSTPLRRSALENRRGSAHSIRVADPNSAAPDT
jgi:hypothetical protein